MNELKPLTDTSPMPFGKYEGLSMQDVPSDYFHYLWGKGFKSIKTTVEEASKLTNKHQQNSALVALYIRENLDALKMEDTDLIWQ